MREEIESRTSAGRAAFGLLVAFALLAFGPAGAAGAAVQPYGTHDAGGFRNVLPPGEAGVDNVGQLAAHELDSSSYPDHWIDQQPLYENLLYASPTLRNSQIGDFYKDATFGVKPGQVGSTSTPATGVTIVRDAPYGIPHIYGDTRAEVMFGAGYAGAQDRLFLMDILRHTGRADLSSFIGGSAGNRAMDRTQWQIAPYTEADLQSQIDIAPTLYGALGQHVVDDVQSYVDGINAYISDALANPLTLLPSEYAALGKTPQPWTATDVLATASLIGGIFGKGGGREVDSAQTLRALVRRFGRGAGRQAWTDFRSKNDPEAPTTVARRFPYETASPFSRRGLAMPDPGSVRSAPVAPRLSSRRSGARQPLGDIGSQLLRAARSGHASNWELVSARESRTGHPVGVLGPQVGYYVPQILMEEDIHGPGLDARGASFPGVNLYILLGHGRDYAWSATTATADNVDTFAEVLCRDAFHYRYRGHCLAMDKLQRTNSWTPNGIDMTTSGSETLTAYRTVHGIVYARGTVGGRKVAFASARSTYFHEADSAAFFARMNDPQFMRSGPDAFRRAIRVMSLAFNWSYIDSKHIAYYLSGWYPQRAAGTSPDFPILGTGKYDWKGYDPKTHTADWVPVSQHPHAVDPPFLVSWNNKQAPGWSAADDQYAYGSTHRSQMIAEKIAHDIRGPRKASLAQVAQAMEESASQDLRADAVLPAIFRAIGTPASTKLRRGLAELRAWRRAGGHRRDLDRNGQDEHGGAIALMDAWWPRLVKAEFRPALGASGFDAVRSMLPVGDHTGGSPNAPDFFSGWWGYVSKDLRDLFGPSPRGGPYSRVYCGKGSKPRCRAALRRSLSQALSVTPDQLYGHGDCSGDPQPDCYDQNRSTIASAIGVPPFPFQNRPTFQQTVSVQRNLP